MAEESIFTKIINGDIPCSKVYEDDKVIAIMALNAIRPGHTLVIPKEPVDHFYHMEDELLTHVVLAGKRIANSIEKAYQPVKVGTFVVGLEVRHAHLHVLPIYDLNDITSKALVEGGIEASTPEELEANASKIRENL